MSKITVLGKNVKYDTNSQLGKKLNIEKTDTNREKIKNALQAKRNIKKPLVIYDAMEGKFDQISLQDKPLLIKEFCNSQRLSNKLKNKILKHDYTKENLYIKETGNEFIKLIEKKDSFTEDDELLINYAVDIRIIRSQTNGTKETNSVRHVAGTYKGTINKLLDYENLMHIIIEPEDVNMFLQSEAGENSSYWINKTPINERQISSGKYYNRYYDDGSIWNDEVKEINYEDFSPFIKKVLSSTVYAYNNAICDYIIIDKIRCNNYNNNKVFDLKNMKLKLATPYDISCNIYNEIIDIKTENDENCVIKYLENKYKSKRQNIATAYFKNSDISEGISTDEIKNFCIEYKIKMIAYDINGNTIEKYKPIKKSKRANLIFIAYNNHIYPLKNKILNKKSKTDYTLNNMKSEKTVNKEFNKLIDNKILPTDITFNSSDNIIKSFVHNNTLYFNNKSYDMSHKILSLFNIEDKLKYYTNEFSLIKNLEELYGITDTYSYFPHIANNKNFVLPG